MPAATSSSPTAQAPSRDLRTDAGLASALRLNVLRLARRIRVERRDNDLSLSQLAVLGTLSRFGPLSAGELAAAENVKPPSMTRTISCLETVGLVTRRAHDTDGRQVVVELTEAARHVLEDDRRRREAWLAKRLGSISPAEREVLRQAAPILERLAGS
ncbi:MAG: MarR family transcriptional regulator [Acidimicrobiia bacterium]|nr:MarR family transcriptional regulator [Acidimicrobiia bacterium]